MNKITEKYFSHQNFAGQAKAALRDVCGQTGFVVGGEIYRGRILDNNKVGSVIYSGIYKDNPAALKLQGLKPEVNETDLMADFEKQNKSKVIRLPKIYLSQKWSKAKGYGFIISEFVSGKKIYGDGLAVKKDMRIFADFYREFRAKAVKKAFIKQSCPGALDFSFDRVLKWTELCRFKKYTGFKDYKNELIAYRGLADKFLADHPMVFGHGHLSPDDILASKDGQYILLSNLFWRWQPKYYDLAFNVYTRLQQLRDESIGTGQIKKYINNWLKIYQTIPGVKKDGYFRRRILTLLLERSLGAILVDVGSNQELAKNKKQFKHFIKLHKQIFAYLRNQLTE